jgi:hypothetical protein
LPTPCWLLVMYAVRFRSVRIFEAKRKVHEVSRSGQTLLVDTELRVICPDREADHWAPTGHPIARWIVQFPGFGLGKILAKTCRRVTFCRQLEICACIW